MFDFGHLIVEVGVRHNFPTHIRVHRPHIFCCVHFKTDIAQYLFLLVFGYRIITRSSSKVTLNCVVVNIVYTCHFKEKKMKIRWRHCACLRTYKFVSELSQHCERGLHILHQPGSSVYKLAVVHGHIVEWIRLLK